MKGDTVLDYAEFQLTPKRTRCELFISADGLMEKLASGFVKPFITHLRAAEVQVAKGNQVIRLESQGGYGKHHHHQQSANAWFCKGTLERFVRFVSTPEIIERVKTIQDELSQLEQVRSALVNTFAQNSDRFMYGDSTPGGQQSRDDTHAVPRRFSTDEENEGDASKRELLRAMEARLSALQQEQNVAFTRANAAGFDSNSIANLMTFADDFGADRLNDACVQFLALSRKRVVPRREEESADSDIPLDNSWLYGTKRKLDFGANKMQTTNSSGLETRETGPVRKDLSQNMGFGLHPIGQNTDPPGGTFFAGLQQMSQQVEARPIEDFGWQMDANEPLSQGSQNDTSDSTSTRQAATETCLLQSQKQNGDSISFLRERTHSLPALKVRTEGPRLWNASSVEAHSAKNLPEDEACIAKDNVKKPETTSGTEESRNDSQSTQGETPARRLSVQAAISLFESKKKDSNEPPFRKLIKQESRKILIESCNSPSEKSVLKRWSAASPRSLEANSVQEKKNLESGGAERHQEPMLEIVQDGANKVSSSDRMVDSKPHPTLDEQARENFKKSLSNLLHPDSTQHFGKPKESDVMVQHVQQVSPIQQLPNNTLGRIVGPETKKDQSTIDRSTNLLMPKMDMSLPSKAEIESSLTAMLNTRPLKKPVAEEKPDSQPAPNTASLDYNGKIEQEAKDKGIMKAQNMKEILPKPSGSVSYRPKMSAPVSAPVPMEQDVGPVAPVVHKPEQVFDKRAEATKIKEVPDHDKQSGKNMSYGKSSAQRKPSLGKDSSTNLLTTSVDFHMQALVKMVEHQYSNLSLNGVNTPTEQRGEQRGKFYDQYSKLRDAKLRAEHPMKRAEREAKLKSMQETLERRKAEMETRGVRLSKKKVQGARVVDSGGEKNQPQKAGLSVAVVEQKDLKDEEEDTDQEEFSLRSQKHSLDYSNPSSPASTPRSSRNRSSSLKSLAPAKLIPILPKSSSITRHPARSATSSSRPAIKNPGSTPGQGKTQSLDNSTGDTIAVKTVLNMKDMAKSSLIRPIASARVHPRSNGATNEGVTLDEDVNNAAKLKELRHPSLVTRKNVASIAVSKSLSFEAGMLQGSPMDQQEGATDVMADGKPSLGFGTTQEVKPFLRKGRGIGPGSGPGIMKQKASVLVDTPKGFDEDTSADNKQDGASPSSVDMTSSAENSIEVHETEETENIGKIEEQAVLDTSCTAMLPGVNDDLTSSSSRPSSGGPTDSGEVEALDDLPESASENDKPCPDSISPNEEHHEGARLGVVDPAAQESFLQALNSEQKEGKFMLSNLFSQKNSESLPHNPGFVTSSMSFREASLPHGNIGSPFPASVSHPYSALLQRGAVSSRFSPPRSNALDLPTGSPALWNASPARKYVTEPDMIHSNRQVNGQKPASMLPLPPKEPSKGFKRLLHFGRKSRTSETTTTDCVSVSTTSEGDDDADEVREFGSQLSDEVLRKIRMQKKGFEYGNQGGDHYGFADQDTPQFFGSAIPPPPANFKLREEHLSGGNLIKAPRSFFSLSPFRSKGSEGKSR